MSAFALADLLPDFGSRAHRPATPAPAAKPELVPSTGPSVADPSTVIAEAGGIKMSAGMQWQELDECGIAATMTFAAGEGARDADRQHSPAFAAGHLCTRRASD